MSKKVSFEYNASDKDQKEFFESVEKTLVESSGYGGIGGHENQDHHGHGTHSQVSIKVDDTVVNIREKK